MIFSTIQEDPIAGWTDTVSAGGSVVFPVAFGFARHFFGDPDIICDSIPCCMVANSIIVETVKSVLYEPKLTVVHCTTSTTNPATLEKFYS